MSFKINIPENSILGLHYSGMHDSSVSIVSENGEIIFASSLERFTRIKGDGRFPFEILKFLPLENITTVALTNSEKYIIPQENYSKIHPLKLKHPIMGDRSHSPIWKEQIESFFYNKNINYFNHHLCHASSSFYLSGFDEAVCLVYDGGMSNEHYFGGVYIASKEKGIKTIDLFSAQEYANITSLYLSITALLGFKPLRHEGKITGLAAFGEIDIKCKEILEELLHLPKPVQWINKYEYNNIPSLIVNHRLKELYLKKLSNFKKEDIAATLQNITEVHIYKILQNISKLGIKCKNICLAGGLFANVKLNQRVYEYGFDNIFIAPPMGDDGTSLGAAFLCLDINKRKQIKFKNVYLGYEEKRETLDKILSKYDVKQMFLKRDEIPKFIAEKLSEGKIIAFFQKKAEFGPRALGNRSILAPATQKSINDGLNKKLNRTEFMPFAPIIRDINVNKYFKIKEGERKTARFMTITCYCTDLASKDVPAVVHVDNTARPQVLIKEDNKLLYEILKEYENITNIYALVNTSFNLHEEPIVNSYEDAIRGFFEAGLDYLYMDGVIISLEQNKDLYIKFLREKIYNLIEKMKDIDREKEKYFSYYIEEKKEKEILNNKLKEEIIKIKELESKNYTIKSLLSIFNNEEE